LLALELQVFVCLHGRPVFLLSNRVLSHWRSARARLADKQSIRPKKSEN
jgi:hypothetical protein